MVVLDFMLDEVELRECRERLTSADPAALQETYFIMPVRLRIGDAELLQVRDAPEYPYLPLPLLHLATVGAQRIRDAARGRETKVDLPGAGVSLRFSKAGSDLCARSELNDDAGCASLEHWTAALDHFVTRVQDVLSTGAPDLVNTAAWANWFGGPH
jgi:hypothetical protein